MLCWDDLRYFLALYRCGKLSAAGKSLHVRHTTVARRVRELESALNTTLFEKKGSGYEATLTGKNLVAYAEEVERTMLGLEDKVCGSDIFITGSVRIGSPDDFSNRFLASQLPELLFKYPQLEIELQADYKNISLAHREVDLLITPVRPTTGRLVLKKLMNHSLGLFAAKHYLDKHVVINSVTDLMKHQLISSIETLVTDDNEKLLSLTQGFEKTPFGTCNLTAQYEATLQGYGFCLLPHYMINTDELIEVLPQNFRLSRTLWLVTHEDVRNISRIKAVSQFISNAIDKEKPPLSKAS